MPKGRKVQILKDNPKLDFGGWRIRCRNGIGCYALYLNEGIVVKLKDGKEFHLGTQNREEFKRRIFSPI